MDKFDRTMQKDILSYLYDIHPNSPEHERLNAISDEMGNYDSLISNLIYLQGHGLIKVEFNSRIGGKRQVNVHRTEITSKGIDFIRDDGGLGAILNVVNVRLHSDTLNKLESIISASNAPAEDKVKLTSTLRKLPEDAIKHLNLKLLDMGLARLPDAFHAIQTAMQNL